MSRTYRNRDIGFIKKEINQIQKIFNYIQKTGEFDLNLILSTAHSYSLRRLYSMQKKLLNMKMQTLSEEQQLDFVLEFISENIKANIRELRILKSDRNNWRGSAYRSTKEYSNMKSRSGKRSLKNKIMKEADLDNLDLLNDELIFPEPNLGNIRGAIWIFD